jgi:sugar/nucleoside kinase (ribokinase family)
LPYIDICSPNANELAGFLGDSEIDAETGQISRSFVERACEQLLGSMPLRSFALVIRCGAQGCYVAKNGGRRSSSKRSSSSKNKRPANRPRGGLTLDTDLATLFADLLDSSGNATFSFTQDAEIDPGIERWLPAYFTEKDAEAGKVVDPTGGGNGFLGGMSVALARGKGPVEAAAWGSVAASFMIEQVGIPVLGVGMETEAGEARTDGSDATKPVERETWNGDSVQGRLERLRERCGSW